MSRHGSHRSAVQDMTSTRMQKEIVERIELMRMRQCIRLQEVVVSKLGKRGPTTFTCVVVVVRKTGHLESGKKRRCDMTS